MLEALSVLLEFIVSRRDRQETSLFIGDKGSQKENSCVVRGEKGLKKMSVLLCFSLSSRVQPRALCSLDKYPYHCTTSTSLGEPLWERKTSSSQENSQQPRDPST